MKKYAIIVAGGNGTRMNAAIPKQFLLLGQYPILYHTIQQFTKAFADTHIVLVLPEAHLEKGQLMVSQYFSDANIQLTAGGPTRFHSVKNGLQKVSQTSVVFIHDGVRCLVSVDLIKRCYDKALESGTAIPVVSCKDSIRHITDIGNEALDRDKVKFVQTPQTFQSEIILKAFEQDYREAFTDDAMVVEASGVKLELVEGEEKNIKITHPMDLEFAAQFFIQSSKDGSGHP